jgi:hypothetical protein
MRLEPLPGSELNGNAEGVGSHSPGLRRFAATRGLRRTPVIKYPEGVSSDAAIIVKRLRAHRILD